MFYPVDGQKIGCINGSTIIVPSVSIGNVPQLAVDLLVNTLKPTLLGHICHEDLIPIVGANSYDEKADQISVPCEVFFLEEKNLIFLQIRGAIVTGFEKNFCNDLISWLISIKAKKVITLMSMSAEMRTDEELQGSQLKYLVPSPLKEEFEAKLKHHGMSDYDGHSANQPSTSGTVDTRVYIPEGGFGQYLYDIGNRRNVPNMGMMMYTYEGDNEREATLMAESIVSVLDLDVHELIKPVSWTAMYGCGPPPELI